MTTGPVLDVSFSKKLQNTRKKYFNRLQYSPANNIAYFQNGKNTIFILRTF